MRCIRFLHQVLTVFLLVIQVGRFTTEEQRSVQALQELFGEEASKYMIVVFTHGDALNGPKIEDYVENGHEGLLRVIQSCVSRYVVFDNTKVKNKAQVRRLIEKMYEMVAANGGECFTQECLKKQKKIFSNRKRRERSAELLEYQFSFLGILDNRVALFPNEYCLKAFMKQFALDNSSY